MAYVQNDTTFHSAKVVTATIPAERWGVQQSLDFVYCWLHEMLDQIRVGIGTETIPLELSRTCAARGPE